MTFETVLKTSLDAESITYVDENISNCTIYKDLVKEWNEKINLTSITDDPIMAEKHFFDSIIMQKFVDLTNKSLIDVGTGAGFPGLPLKIMDDSISLTLLDSLNKRVNFLKSVGDALKLENVKYLHGRAEDYAKSDEYRETFDIATSRAVARLNILAEYCLPYVKVGGMFVAMKGKDYLDELDDAKKAIEILGGKISGVYDYNLVNDSSKHYLVVIEKVKKTPFKYPRKAGKPTKNPL